MLDLYITSNTKNQVIIYARHPAGFIHYIKYQKTGNNARHAAGSIHYIKYQKQVIMLDIRAGSIHYIKFQKAGNNARHPSWIYTSNTKNQVIMQHIPSWFHTLHQIQKIR